MNWLFIITGIVLFRQIILCFHFISHFFPEKFAGSLIIVTYPSVSRVEPKYKFIEMASQLKVSRRQISYIPIFFKCVNCFRLCLSRIFPCNDCRSPYRFRFNEKLFNFLHNQIHFGLPKILFPSRVIK